MLAQLLKKYAGKIPPKILRHVGNFWMPFLGAGIKISYLSSDYRETHVTMKLRWYNKNYVGTHFGGSIYAMTDPFYMIMLINNLGRDYIVWDKGAKIDFIKPGRNTLKAEFILTDELLQEIKQKVDSEGKYVFDIPVNVVNKSDEVIATVKKEIYIRQK